MSRVFVLEPATVDIRPAEAWGEIQILFPDGVGKSPLDADYYAGRIINKLEKLSYDKQEDLICLVGTMTSMSVAVAAIVNRFNSFKVLMFNAETSTYVLKVLGRWRNTYEGIPNTN